MSWYLFKKKKKNKLKCEGKREIFGRKIINDWIKMKYILMNIEVEACK